VIAQTTTIIDIAPENTFNDKPGPSFFVNPEREGTQKKPAWMEKRFKEELTIKGMSLTANQTIFPG
jgi:hypothetical protein